MRAGSRAIVFVWGTVQKSRRIFPARDDREWNYVCLGAEVGNEKSILDRETRMRRTHMAGANGTTVRALKADMEARHAAWHRAQRALSTATYVHGMDSYAVAVAKKALKAAEAAARLATTLCLTTVDEERTAITAEHQRANRVRSRIAGSPA